MSVCLRRLVGVAALAFAALLIAGCGGDEGDTDAPTMPAITEVAAGALDDGRAYSLGVDGDGALCVQIEDGETLCAERSATWPVAVLEPAGTEAAVAVAGLPACVRAVRVEPSGPDATTVVEDDVAYVVAGPLPDKATTMVGIGRTRAELLRVELVRGQVVAAPNAAC